MADLFDDPDVAGVLAHCSGEWGSGALSFDGGSPEAASLFDAGAALPALAALAEGMPQAGASSAAPDTPPHLQHVPLSSLVLPAPLPPARAEAQGLELPPPAEACSAAQCARSLELASIAIAARAMLVTCHPACAALLPPAPPPVPSGLCCAPARVYPALSQQQDCASAQTCLEARDAWQWAACAHRRHAKLCAPGSRRRAAAEAVEPQARIDAALRQLEDERRRRLRSPGSLPSLGSKRCAAGTASVN